MKFVSVRDLHNITSKIIDQARLDDVIITTRGKPEALLIKMDEEDIEDYILAKYFGLERMLAGLESVKLIPAKRMEQKYKRRRGKI